MRRVKATLGTAMILLMAAFGAQADPAAGKKLFEGNNCQTCHYTDGPAKEKSIADQLAKKGPELWYAGSKFQGPWLEAWLADPKPIRSLKYNSFNDKNAGDHPKLAAADAKPVAEFLMSLTAPNMAAGVVKADKGVKGKMVFTKKMPCLGCHQYPVKDDQVSGGLSGPSLVGAGKRLNPDWILAYLQNPQTFKPVKQMPVFTGILADRDMQDVANFVASF